MAIRLLVAFALLTTAAYGTTGSGTTASPSGGSGSTSFTSICAATGQRARCCVLPILGQAILCQAPQSNNITTACPKGLYSTPQCCATDLLGIADLNCKTPPTSSSGGSSATTARPSGGGSSGTTASSSGGSTSFTSICASIGQRARCCALPVAGQAVLCQAPQSNDTKTACPNGLYSTPQCCATDVLGVADLDCQTPPTNSNGGGGSGGATTASPSGGGGNFNSICASIGQRARCCVLPVAGQGILCQAPQSDDIQTACPKGLYSTPQCCATDALGVADLDCAAPPTNSNGGGGSSSTTSGGSEGCASCCPGATTASPAGGSSSFSGTCAAIGQRARCCVLPVAGQGILCQAPQTNDIQTACKSGLYTTPQCCATDVLGVADLDCAAPPSNSNGGGGISGGTTSGGSGGGATTRSSGGGSGTTSGGVGGGATTRSSGGGAATTRGSGGGSMTTTRWGSCTGGSCGR